MLQTDPPVKIEDLLGKVQYIVRNQKVVVPHRKLRPAERIVADLVRCSNTAARFIVGMKGLQQSLHASLS